MLSVWHKLYGSFWVIPYIKIEKYTVSRVQRVICAVYINNVFLWELLSLRGLNWLLSEKMNKISIFIIPSSVMNNKKIDHLQNYKNAKVSTCNCHWLYEPTQGECIWVVRFTSLISPRQSFIEFYHYSVFWFEQEKGETRTCLIS